MSKPTATVDSVVSPYGDRSLARPNTEPAWRGTSLVLLVLALVLFLGAAVSLTAAVVRFVFTFNQSVGADIGLGLVLVMFIALVLSACGVLRLAFNNRK